MELFLTVTQSSEDNLPAIKKTQKNTLLNVDLMCLNVIWNFGKLPSGGPQLLAVKEQFIEE